MRLEEVQEEERRWMELEPCQQHRLNDQIHCEGSCARAAKVGLTQAHIIERCILPSRKDPTPPWIDSPIILSPYQSNIRAWDAYEDVLIILSRWELFCGIVIAP